MKKSSYFREPEFDTYWGKMRDGDIRGKVASSSIRISLPLTHGHRPSYGPGVT
jgi:hypothetical protein